LARKPKVDLADSLQIARLPGWWFTTTARISLASVTWTTGYPDPAGVKILCPSAAA